MVHGTEHYFLEHARNERRVLLIIAIVGGVWLAGLGVMTLPAMRFLTRDIPVMRFGFAGPERYVRTVMIEAVPGPLEPLRDVGKVIVRGAQVGGGGRPRAARAATTRPAHRGPRGEGQDADNLVERALRGAGRVPIFQSTELVIETLVRPVYPERARDRGIEGRVAVLARVDTTGMVVETEVMDGSGTDDLDEAAETAVLQCRFQPYRVEGEAREVYAVFRFAFRIY